MERVGYDYETSQEYQNFLDREEYLGQLFDIWSDPNRDDVEQYLAYGDFWDILHDEFGLDRDSFDWHQFKEQYATS